MLVGNYGGGNGCVDNDDGSLFFMNNHNVAVYGTCVVHEWVLSLVMGFTPLPPLFQIRSSKVQGRRNY